jgi:thiol-disulfide isomerase/thioredoxin
MASSEGLDMFSLRVVIAWIGVFFSALVFASSSGEFKFDPAEEELFGSVYQLADLAGTMYTVPAPGKLTLINFWATFCGPCRQEMPALEKFWKRYQSQGVEVIAVALDGDRKRAVEKFASRYELTLPILLDNDSGISSDYAVSVLPVSYIIDAKGVVLARIVGERNWDSEPAFAFIESYLEQQKTIE